MTSFVIVHTTGFYNPFMYGAGGDRGPDRNRALRISRDIEKYVEDFAKCFGDRKVIADEWQHPEVEEALLKCFQGDLSALPVIQAYRDKAGSASVAYFARSVFGGGLGPGAFSDGTISVHKLLDAWEAKK